MTDSEEQVMSPCVGICCPDQNDVCMGCFRTMDEITHWWDMSNEEKRQLLDVIAVRKKQA